MSYSVRVILDERNRKRDGYPLILRIIANRKSTSIPLGVTLEPSEWNESSQTIRSTCKKIKNIGAENAKIKTRSAEAFSILSALDESGDIKRMGISEIKTRILNESIAVSIAEYTKTVIEEMKGAGRFGNAKAYNDFLQWVINYNGTADIPLEHITPFWIKKMEQKYLAKGNSVNGLGVKLRALRALVNRAISDKILPKDAYPFDQYQVRRQDTAKRALPKEALEKIKSAKLTNKTMERTRLVFLFSFYMRGASFTDICFLKLKDITNDRIYYNRRKTAKLYNVGISEPLETLIKHFSEDKTSEDYILPFLNKDMSLERAYSISRGAIRNYNRDLKKLATHLGIDFEYMSTNTIRHSFASLARDSGIDISVVSKMLGHSDIKTTQIYLSSIRDEAVDEASDKVFGSLR